MSMTQKLLKIILKGNLFDVMKNPIYKCIYMELFIYHIYYIDPNANNRSTLIDSESEILPNIIFWFRFTLWIFIFIPFSLLSSWSSRLTRVVRIILIILYMRKINLKIMHQKYLSINVWNLSNKLQIKLNRKLIDTGKFI